MPEWYQFRCKMPREAYRRLEDELERIKDLAGIDREKPDEIQDGLAIELMCANSANTPDESVV